MAESTADLFHSGLKLQKIAHNGVMNWFMKLHPIKTLWNLQPTYILAQTSFIIGGVTTLIHAFLTGGRWPYLWIATVLHGILIETICYILPDVDNFWHSTTPVMFLGGRLPLHIILLYPSFYCQATFAVTKMNLPQRIFPFAVGLFVVLIDLPYDIMSVKFVHWTWHDTDPNIYDRHYWVPWNSYFFHATFSAGFTFWFNYSCDQSQSAKKNLQNRRGVITELKSVMCAVLLGTPTGILFFVLIYHPLHDVLKIHSEVTFFTLFSVFAMIVCTNMMASGLRTPIRTEEKDYTKILIPHLLIHYGLFYGCGIFGSPEKEVSIGLHEPVGPCNEYTSVQTVLGMVLKKRKYLCIEDYDEAYFDFHCVPGGPPSERAIWYGICGTPFENRAEYIVIFSVITMIAGSTFYTLHKGSTKKLDTRQKKKA
ncbi:unnamed protein product [Bemisia tabaci]|uniref:DUF7802 domain-containing protein n=1 Tax=Bemisia tabaci TaxID=7038 RepID=A0A9P0A728_BEMTA|nr:PREDICTED: uncharacterized protein LOC109039627 [Bemisia tabaci]CAH0385600.1 unnamed protein product [Bemisia tabaci]